MSRFHRLYEQREPDSSQVIKAALEHFQAAGGIAAYVIPIPNTTPTLYVACGEASQILAMLEQIQSSPHTCAS